jgi:hypothetical protein
MKVKLILNELIKAWKYESKSGINPYINFSKLILKLVTWKNPNELRKDLWIDKKESIIKHLPIDDLRKINILDNQISKLLEKWNLNYQDIKNLNLKIF